MRKKSLAMAMALSSALISACGGGGGSDAPVKKDKEPVSTTYSVGVDDGTQAAVAAASRPSWFDQLRSLVVPTAFAEPVPQLDPSQFSVVVINGDDNGTPNDVSDDTDLTLGPDEVNINPIGNGQYEINVPGEPRFDCYIATDLDGDGQLDLRAPTVNEDLNIDPASEFVTRLVEENAADFANFDVAEIDSILREVQSQVDNDSDLRQQIADANNIEDAITALDGSIGPVVTSEFETAAQPTPTEAELAAVDGNYQFIGASLSPLAAGSDTNSFSEGEFEVSGFHAPADLTLGNDKVNLEWTGTETSINTTLVFGSFQELEDEIEDYDDTGEPALPLAITPLGLRLDQSTRTETHDDGGEETSYGRSVNFIDVTGDMSGFMSSSAVRRDSDSDSWVERMMELEWFILGKKRDSFDHSSLAGDWGMVTLHSTVDRAPDPDLIRNEVEANPLSIDTGGVLNLESTASHFNYIYEIPTDGSALMESQDSSFTPQALPAESISVDYSNNDGTFSLPTASDETSEGVVFSGDDMLAAVNTKQEAGSQGETSILLAVRRGSNTASQTRNLLEGRDFRIAGALTFNAAGTVDVENISTGTLSFDGTAANAELSGFSKAFSVDMGPIGWDAGSGIIDETGFSVAVSSEGLVQIERSNGTGFDAETVEFNGFLSQDGQNIILTVTSKEFDDSENPEGTLGLVFGRCTNC